MGSLLILEFSTPTAPGLKPLYDAYSFRVLPTCSGRFIAGDEDGSYRYLAESISKHPDQETLLGMMNDAGFDGCRYHNLSWRYRRAFTGATDTDARETLP